MPRVVVFGSSNTDMTVRVPRLPAAGQTILGSTFATTPGGKGANQAVAARRAGADVVFVTAVGNDDLGKHSLALYEREGIDVSHVRIAGDTASGVAMIFVEDDGENMIAVAPGANGSLTPDDVDRLPAALFCKDDLLLVSLEIPVKTAIRALHRGFEAGMRTILNPAPAPALAESEIQELLSAAKMVTPNRLEALALAGMNDDRAVEPDWPECGSRLKAMGPDAVLITLGSRGCQVIAAETWSVGAPRVDAVDTVGAGDAFNGALAAALAGGRELHSAVVWANAAAALAVTLPGAQSALPFRDAIDRLATRADTC
jgi:ribokinase